MANEKKRPNKRSAADSPSEIFLSNAGKTDTASVPTEKVRSKKKTTVKYKQSDEHEGLSGILLFAVVLMSISAVVAGMLALINAQTKDIIAGYEQETRQNALESIFPDADEFVDATEFLGDSAIKENTSLVYKVYSKGELIGYCAGVTATGFSSSGFELMVGSDLLNNVTSINVVSQSETPGIGGAVLEDKPEFFAQFTGLPRPVEFNNSVTAVTGATVTSTAVLDGINTALEAIDIVRLNSASDTEGAENNG